MRELKNILRGHFPGEDRHVQYWKCNNCGYANTTGKICPNCEYTECERI